MRRRRAATSPSRRRSRRSPLFFGDLVTAHAEVLVNRRELDPDTVRLEADLRAVLTRRPAAGVALDAAGRRPRSTCATRCSASSKRACRSPAGSRSRSSWCTRGRAATNLVTYNHGWPRVDVVSRVAPAALATDPPPWRQQVALPAVSYRLEPGKLAAALTLAAALLVLGAFALVVREITRRRKLLLERARFRSALAHALELARASAARGPDDRRRALALLARVLAFDPNGGRRLAPAAARLAWGRSEPSTTGLESLVDEIEKTVSVR